MGVATGDVDVPAETDAEAERFIGGTLPYMSPEHFGEGEFTSASDVYSLGAIMFELLEGQLLFDLPDLSFDAFREAHLYATVPRASEADGRKEPGPERNVSVFR